MTFCVFSGKNNKKKKHTFKPILIQIQFIQIQFLRIIIGITPHMTLRLIQFPGSSLYVVSYFLLWHKTEKKTQVELLSFREKNLRVVMGYVLVPRSLSCLIAAPNW